MDDNEKKLEALVANAHDELADFLEMGKAVGATLDFSIASIASVEKILLQTNAEEEKDEDLFFDAWLYTGMVAQKATNGKWIISGEEDESNGYPSIAYANAYNDIFCPSVAVRHFLKTKKRGDILAGLHV